MSHGEIDLPPFSTEKFHQSLDVLAQSFISKGMDVKSGLQPALTENEIREQCSWFPGQLTPELVSLYTWSGGTEEDVENPFWFRDTTFCSLPRTKNKGVKRI